jgi:hypothetical protein
MPSLDSTPSRHLPLHRPLPHIFFMSLQVLSHRLSQTLFSKQSILLTLSWLWLGWNSAVGAVNKPASTAPAVVKTLLQKIDTAANNRQSAELAKYYSQNFTTSDGLNKATWHKSLGQMWQNYSNLKYTTTLEGWGTEAGGYTTQTVTKITGVQKIDGRTMNLQSTIQSRQKIVGGQILQQEILQERTQVTSGAQPPTVELNLPTKIQTNAEYNFDAIVREPLGEDVLMGATVEQPVSPQGYAQPTNYKLELLTAGGLFKIARAPGKSGDYWLSTIFIRPSGMTTLTQRIHVMRAK